MITPYSPIQHIPINHQNSGVSYHHFSVFHLIYLSINVSFHSFYIEIILIEMIIRRYNPHY